MNFNNKSVSVSIVDHAHGALLNNCLDDLSKIGCVRQIILTLNIEDKSLIIPQNIHDRVKLIHNSEPKGFGANHNFAFRYCESELFCVLNPDVRINSNPFETLFFVTNDSSIGVVAPAILSSEGNKEDTCRFFPTIEELFLKFFGGKSEIVIGDAPMLQVDWIAGMFMLFPRKVFEEMGGFDERYFLYYEDVDMCARLALAGYKRLVCQDVSVIHDARRTSHRNLRYALWHLRSIIRFFCSETYRRLKRGHCASS